MIINAQKVSEIKECILAIVQFGPPSESDGLFPGRYFQVVVNPFRFSPCGNYIRFGIPGDEIVGWQNATAMYVVAELGKVPSGAEPSQIEFRWGKSPALLEFREDLLQ